MTTPQQDPKRKKGCIFYGCLTLAIVSLAVLVGGGLGLYFLYQKAEAFVHQYAAVEPMELTEVQYTESDLEQFQERMNIFTTGLEEGKPTVPLALKGEDLNMLLASADNMTVFSDGVRAYVEGDEVKGQMSLKLGDLGAPFFKDRYMNGEVAFQVSLTNGLIDVRLTQLLVNGEALPEEYLAAIRKENLAEGVSTDPDFQATLSQLESIQVRDGILRVVPKTPE